jgi:type II secretory pathway pseudopilin PulG
MPKTTRSLMANAGKDPVEQRQPTWLGAFTLVELLAVICILVLLAALLIPNFGKIVAKAQEARCMSNMRTIHSALSTYLNDNGNIWPQGPAPDAGSAWSQFWITTLGKQGIPAKTWQCPTLQSMLGSANASPSETVSIHYIPTMFSAIPGLARRWPGQPWLIERADAHGNGALICFTDGSIKPFNKVLAEQGLR